MDEVGDLAQSISALCITREIPGSKSDVVPPQATCPAGITVTVPWGAGGITVTWTEPQAFDDSGVPPILVSRSHTPGQFFIAGRSTTVTYTWRDGADNEGSCSFSILVTEICINNNDECDYWFEIGECIANPDYMLLNCQKSCGLCQDYEGKTTLLCTNIVTRVDSGQTSTEVTYSVTATGGTPPHSFIYAPISGSTFNTGTTRTVLVTTTDVTGAQAMCQFTVQVLAVEIICPTVSPSSFSQVLFDSPTLSNFENPSSVTMTYSYESQTQQIAASQQTHILDNFNFVPGSNTISVSASDGANTAACSFTYTKTTTVIESTSSTDSTITLRLSNTANYTEYQIRYFSDTTSREMEFFDYQLLEVIVLETLIPGTSYNIEIKGLTQDNQLVLLMSLVVSTKDIRIVATTDTTISIQISNSDDNYIEYQVRYTSGTNTREIEVFDALQEIIVLENLKPGTYYNIEIKGLTMDNQLHVLANLTQSTDDGKFGPILGTQTFCIKTIINLKYENKIHL
ncbi:uncharacterized protein [Amphiura filiformis]|uniref:uncharacterized protein n=1 Tax=Amphiura filiformis TaxID=82378 RepID=UPI003B216F20